MAQNRRILKTRKNTKEGIAQGHTPEKFRGRMESPDFEHWGGLCRKRGV